MRVTKVSEGSGLADPSASGWSVVVPITVPLAPVSLQAQPTEYIREAWKDRPYGQTPEAQFAAASDGQRLYLRVEWQDDVAPNQEFQDAVGVVFPINGIGAIATLGDAEKPVALWFWEHGRPGPLRLRSRGPGCFRKDDGNELGAIGVLKDGRWSVVLNGPAIAAGTEKLGLAVWNGSNDERAGLAAVSQEWLPLEWDQGGTGQ
jgi:DMSO reductase family type II enzyme heme b subunit